MGLKGSGLEFTESGYLRGCGHCCEEEILWDWAAMGAAGVFIRMPFFDVLVD